MVAFEVYRRLQSQSADNLSAAELLRRVDGTRAASGGAPDAFGRGSLRVSASRRNRHASGVCSPDLGLPTRRRWSLRRLLIEYPFGERFEFRG